MGQRSSAREKEISELLTKHRKEVRELESTIRKKAEENFSLKARISELEREVDQLKEHNERLLEYANMSEEDLKNLIEQEREKENAYKSLSIINNSIIGAIGLGKSSLLKELYKEVEYGEHK